MSKSAYRWSARSLVLVAAALATACADGAPVAPVGAATMRREADVAETNEGNRLPDLAGCEKLAAPEGSVLVLRAFASGVQIYRWNGTSWGSSVPSATLYADAEGNGVIGTHFGGPTWQSNSGGRVVGAVAERCPVDAASVPWLKLTAVADGPGIFEKVTLIQRLNTVGGVAPSVAGSLIGEEARVPYTADYLFYRAP
jgi:hypothetical protein